MNLKIGTKLKLIKGGLNGESDEDAFAKIYFEEYESKMIAIGTQCIVYSHDKSENILYFPEYGYANFFNVQNLIPKYFIIVNPDYNKYWAKLNE